MKRKLKIPVIKVGGVGGCPQSIFSEIKANPTLPSGGQISTKYEKVI